MLENTIDGGVILRFGLKCLGIFALIFLAAVFTPKMAEYIDKWKSAHSRNASVEHPRTKENYTVRSIYELPPEPEEKSPEHAKKKASVRKKTNKNN